MIDRAVIHVQAPQQSGTVRNAVTRCTHRTDRHEERERRGRRAHVLGEGREGTTRAGAGTVVSSRSIPPDGRAPHRRMVNDPCCQHPGQLRAEVETAPRRGQSSQPTAETSALTKMKPMVRPTPPPMTKPIFTACQQRSFEGASSGALMRDRREHTSYRARRFCLLSASTLTHSCQSWNHPASCSEEAALFL